MWETCVQSLGWEDPLQDSLATHSSILAWRIPRTEETGGLQPMGSQRVRHDWMTNYTHSRTSWKQRHKPRLLPGSSCCFRQQPQFPQTTKTFARHLLETDSSATLPHTTLQLSEHSSESTGVQTSVLRHLPGEIPVYTWYLSAGR